MPKEWLSNCNMCGHIMVTKFCKECKRYHRNICYRCVVHDRELAKLKREIGKP
jgi:recombinational DNA repair protein RecR